MQAVVEASLRYQPPPRDVPWPLPPEPAVTEQAPVGILAEGDLDDDYEDSVSQHDEGPTPPAEGAPVAAEGCDRSCESEDEERLAAPAPKQPIPQYERGDF